MNIKIKDILIIFCFLIIVSNFPYGELSANTLSENIIVKCDISKLPQKLPFLIISDEKINKEELLNKWMPEKSLSNYEEINLMGSTIKRYVSDTKNKKVIVEFGPYGYVYYKAKEYVENPEFISIGKSEEIAENFIKKYFKKIPSDSIKKSTRFRMSFQENGFKITYTRKYEGYKILSTDEYLGDSIDVKIYKNGDFEFERMWHKIEGFSDLTITDLMPIDEALNKVFKNEIKENKLIYIQKIELMYYFNPMEILTMNAMRPLYRITGNGKYYYADGINGYRIPMLRKTASSLKRKPKRVLLLPEEEKKVE